LILAEQLQDDPEHTMSDTQVGYAGVILSSGRDLLSLLNSILELAKVESGTVTVEMADVSVAGLRVALQREFEPVANKNDIGYSIEVAPGTPEEIFTDPNRLRQILKNLLANAFKFTERGEVRLEVSRAHHGWSHETESLENAASVIAFAIRDTGIGIDEDHQRRIFEAFAQGDGTTARLYGGTGLGLSISRELVGVLGGEITLASVPGQGSTFTIYLPMSRHTAVPPAAITVNGAHNGYDSVEALNAADALAVVKDLPDRRIAAYVPAAAVDLSPRAGHGNNGGADLVLEGAKVLVVDDDFRNIFALTALLERAHAVVISAESGPDGIAALERNADVDVVLMDIMMPGMDGYTAIRAIRAHGDFKSLPIIAVTGKVVAGERERCLDAGANGYIPKPVNTDELLSSIGPWLPADTESKP
jgi:hypothetical protein